MERRNIKTVGIAYSLSPNQNILAHIISSLGYRVVFITPYQELKVDLLIVYTNLEFSAERVASEALPLPYPTDTWLSQLVWADTLKWYIDNNTPILAIDKGVFYLKEEFGGIVTYINPYTKYKTKVWSIDSKVQYSISIKGLNSYMYIDGEKSQLYDEGLISICYKVRGKDIYGIQVPLESNRDYLRRTLNILLQDLKQNNDDGNEHPAEEIPQPPRSLPPSSRKHE